MGFFDGIFTGIGGSVLSGVGGILGNRASQKSAREQMDFQREMSNTAHQREVEDLRKAGLNPILSGTGGSGASSPQGASYSAKNPFEGAAENLSHSAQMIQKNPLLKAEVEHKKAEVDLTRQKEKESAASEANLKWDSFVKDDLSKLYEMDRVVKFWQAKGLEQDLFKKETTGKVYDLGGKAIDYGKKLAEDAKTLELDHVIKGGIMQGKEWFGKAKDWLNNQFPSMRYRNPSDTFGEGRGNVPGGDHKAGQKVPWKDVEKQKGQENDLWDGRNWPHLKRR